MQPDQKSVQVYLRADEHRALKTLAAQTDRTIREIVSVKLREVLAANRPHFLDEPQITL